MLLLKPNAGRVHVHVYVIYKVHTIYLVVILMYALHSVFWLVVIQIKPQLEHVMCTALIYSTQCCISLFPNMYQLGTYNLNYQEPALYLESKSNLEVVSVKVLFLTFLPWTFEAKFFVTLTESCHYHY